MKASYFSLVPFDISLCLQMNRGRFHILRQWCKQGCLAFSPLFFLLHALSITRWRCRYSRAPAGWLGGWLACLLETSEIWFTLRACCSKPYPTVCIFPPLFVTVGCTCAGGEGWGWGVPSRHATLHFSGWAQGQEHIWLTKGGRGFRLCVCVCVCVSDFVTSIHTSHTRTFRAHLLLCSRSLCA